MYQDTSFSVSNNLLKILIFKENLGVYLKFLIHQPPLLKSSYIC
ncbi:hypothetical protein GXM_02744 [Nostoc sphaeroides CCNUC1]|uniref:Uncharacterized protein n=1 Tax=Nostoc sphaeroides CCNUC1 TaxID=2653204 RepID=A0A5P8VY07_9NOSO|nr:hypothetical protein GXM_02744 [Nostoc sphaeroides CCNUC1]